ncbi:hypothetical protein [Salipiger mangrovisoli]|uniref:Transposase n=1 Tax=Salipiger mangrovisoli TaxID=2865933 RepID=A0ABR9X848_9RHOB|nr:hypothetical protein [Salipiger mangrovisoli]MBE9639774.1 hypothetical protein [Salipiger mangrovisoli]
MTEITIVGLDLANRVFHVHGATVDGGVVIRKKLSLYLSTVLDDSKKQSLFKTPALDQALWHSVKMDGKVMNQTNSYMLLFFILNYTAQRRQ